MRNWASGREYTHLHPRSILGEEVNFSYHRSRQENKSYIGKAPNQALSREVMHGTEGRIQMSHVSLMNTDFFVVSLGLRRIGEKTLKHYFFNCIIFGTLKEKGYYVFVCVSYCLVY